MRLLSTITLLFSVNLVLIFIVLSLQLNSSLAKKKTKIIIPSKPASKVFSNLSIQSFHHPASKRKELYAKKPLHTSWYSREYFLAQNNEDPQGHCKILYRTLTRTFQSSINFHLRRLFLICA